MKQKALVEALEPLQGMLLSNIKDDDRQQVMDQTLEVIRYWKLQRIVKARLEKPSHPAKMADVHLVFADGGNLPDFTLSILARDVHRVLTETVEDGDGTARRRAEILFKRGYAVALELV